MRQEQAAVVVISRPLNYTTPYFGGISQVLLYKVICFDASCPRDMHCGHSLVEVIALLLYAGATDTS
jgi:hypothetical protein